MNALNKISVACINVCACVGDKNEIQLVFVVVAGNDFSWKAIK